MLIWFSVNVYDNQHQQELYLIKNIKVEIKK